VAETIIKVAGLSKRYKLGTIGTGTLSHDLKRWWQRKRGREDEYLRVDEEAASGEFWALKGVDFEINAGDTVGIIGRNGAGKSTLLKILSRVTSPTRGSVKIGGRIASLLEVGTGFHPEMTGRENIFMNGAIMGMNKAEIRSKLDEIIDFAGVEQYINTPVKRYSSGMYVRLAFAVAAHLESEILIVDEVLAVGDFEFQKKCLGKMGDVSRTEGRTVLFVSHHLSSIKDLCKSSILLNRGVVQYAGGSSEAVNKYLLSFGNSSLNTIDDKVKQQGIVKCTLLEDGDPAKGISDLIADQTLCVSLWLRGYGKSKSRVTVGGRLLDDANNMLGSFFSDYNGHFIELPANETVEVNITNRGVFLCPGAYTILLEVWCDGNRLPSALESFTFDVLPADVFKKGYGPINNNKDNGPLLWQCDWRFALLNE
jgi:ABC-type polysaccharide/polyol phosphate transport system ATPase subunit